MKEHELGEVDICCGSIYDPSFWLHECLCQMAVNREVD